MALKQGTKIDKPLHTYFTVILFHDQSGLSMLILVGVNTEIDIFLFFYLGNRHLRLDFERQQFVPHSKLHGWPKSPTLQNQNNNRTFTTKAL
jgi:hypothetical protein